MTPLGVLILGLVTIGVALLTERPPRTFLVVAGVCVGASLVALWFGEAGATDDPGTSWSDPGPQHALRWAASFGAVALASLIALGWTRARQRRRRAGRRGT